MKRLLIAVLLTGFFSTAGAQSVGMAVEPTTQDDIHPNLARRDVRDATCLRETGSLINTARNQRALREARARHEPSVQVTCTEFGRAYTQDEIRSTGALNIADALRVLSPSIH